MSFEGFEIPAEYADYDKDYDKDYVDESTVMGRTKRGNNKAAVKDAKGLTAAAAAAAPRNTNKSPKKDSDSASQKKSFTPRFVPGVDAGMSDWEMKLKVSSNYQGSGGNYTLESMPKSSTNAPKTSPETSPGTSKATNTAFPSTDGGDTGTLTRPRPTPKKEAAATKAWNAWDEKDPWA